MAKPATAKLRSPNLVQVTGAMQVSTSAERRRRRNMSDDTRWQSL